jgi:hypothetical protein
MALHLSISSFKKYPPACAIVIFILAYIVLEIVCNIFLPTSNLEIQFSDLRERVVTYPAPNIQIMGDSVAAGGILASLFKDDNLSIRNDAVAGGGPAFSYLLLKSEIKAGKIPKTIIVAHSPHTFSGIRTPVLLGRFAHWSELPGLLMEDDIQLSDFMYALLTRFSYILSYRTQIKNLLRGNSAFFVNTESKDPSEQERLNEYNNAVIKGTYSPKPLNQGIWPMYKEQFIVSPLNDEYFSALLDLANQYNIEVFWVTMPVTERVYDAREKIGFNTKFYQYINTYIHTKKLKSIQERFLVYDDVLFDDLSHLNTAGAVLFTKHLRMRMKL